MKLTNDNKQTILWPKRGVLAIAFGLMSIFAATQSVFAASIEGKLEWNRRVALTTTVSGKVESVSVSAGSRVSKHEVLLKLKQVSFNANLKLAKAVLSSARHVYKEAKKELARNKELYERTVISTHDLELAKISHTKSLSRLKTAQAGVSLARLYKSESVLRSPFSAIVIALYVEKGSVVSTSLLTKPMLVVVERGKMKVSALAGLNIIRQLKRGSKVSVSVADQQYSARVSFVGYEPIKNSVMYKIEAVFSLPVGTVLRAGQAARIEY